MNPPKPKKVTIGCASYNLVAFYFPDFDQPWDLVYRGQFLANFYPCSVSLTIRGATATFFTAEAAFQSTKWWSDAAIRAQFENAPTGTDAYNIKKDLDNADLSYAGLRQDGAMKAALASKFSDASLKQALLQTGDAYLLEHNAKKGRDHYWSDDYDGSGSNMLGKSLMALRASLGGSGDPAPGVAVAAFTALV